MSYHIILYVCTLVYGDLRGSQERGFEHTSVAEICGDPRRRRVRAENAGTSIESLARETP